VGGCPRRPGFRCLHDLAVPGAHLPCRSPGTASPAVPARVPRSRARYPLREFTRSGLTSPYAAPHRFPAPASIICRANARNISRTTSGAPAIRVRSNDSPGTGTMSTAATSLPFVS
jgi:hypothetical protein